MCGLEEIKISDMEPVTIFNSKLRQLEEFILLLFIYLRDRIPIYGFTP